MKKILTILTLAAIFVGSGCEKEEKIPAPITGSITLSANQSLGNEDGATKADPATLQYTVQVWTTGENPILVMSKTESGAASQFTMEIALVQGTYDFLFWADYNAGHYNTENLKAVTLTIPQATADAPTAEAQAKKDAFAVALQNVTWDGSGINGSITLERVVAKVSLKCIDPSLVAKNATVSYTGFCDSYNVLSGEASATTAAGSPVTYNLPGIALNGTTGGEDYIFVPTTQTINYSITLGNNNGSETKEVTALPVKKNYATEIVISGNTVYSISEAQNALNAGATDVSLPITSLSTTTANTITIPANVFSTGDVVTVSIGSADEPAGSDTTINIHAPGTLSSLPDKIILEINSEGTVNITGSLFNIIVVDGNINDLTIS